MPWLVLNDKFVLNYEFVLEWHRQRDRERERCSIKGHSKYFCFDFVVWWLHGCCRGSGRMRTHPYVARTHDTDFKVPSATAGKTCSRR
eukprot:1071617-Amphidinium_carterae.1